MLAEIMTARAMKRKLRTDEAQPYRVQVGEMLPHIPAGQRAGVQLGMKWTPGGVLLNLEGGEKGIRLTSTPQKLGGVRWWFTCPECSGRTTSLYWVGHGGAGRWKCRRCCGLRYASSALHKTPAGDRMTLRREIGADFPAIERALEREAKRRAKLYGRLSPELPELGWLQTWDEVRANLLASVGVGEE